MFREINKIIRGKSGIKKRYLKVKIIFLFILLMMLILLFLGFYHHRRSDGTIIVEYFNNSFSFRGNNSVDL